MDILEAYHKDRTQLERELRQTDSPERTAAVLRASIERIGASLAATDTDDTLRQCRQAVLAEMKQMPALLISSEADGKLVQLPSVPETKPAKAFRLGATGAGAVILCALAAWELISGRMNFALLQLLGALLLYIGLSRQNPVLEKRYQAEGIPRVDTGRLLTQMENLCLTADHCTEDMLLLCRTEGTAAGGTVDDAVLDLAAGLLEAGASGRQELAAKSISRAEQVLHRAGIEVLSWDEAHEHMFDILPTYGESRTVRPAFVREGKLLRRGVAVRHTEGGAL